MRIETTEAVIAHRSEVRADESLAVYQFEVDDPENERLYRVFSPRRGAETLEDLARHFDRFRFTFRSMSLV